MKLSLVTLLISVLMAGKAWGQPGGGGGVIIHHLIDKEGNLIDSNDSGLVIRKFILSDEEGLSVREYFKTAEEGSFPKHATVRRGGLYIRPYLNMSKRVRAPHQLIQFAYNGDTTFVEFLDIMKEGLGLSNRLDTLQLIPGLFGIPFGRIEDYYIRKGTESDRKRFDSIRALAWRGLTVNTLPGLRQLDLLLELRHDRFTTVYRNADHTYDTLRLPVKPVYHLSVKSIYLRSSSVNINITDPPMIEEDTLLYRLLVDVRPVGTFPVKKMDDDQQKAFDFVRDLSTKKLTVNDRAFSGRIKVFIPFAGPSIGGTSVSGFRLHILRFDKGKLLKQEYIPDITLDESRIPKRHS